MPGNKEIKYANRLDILQCIHLSYDPQVVAKVTLYYLGFTKTFRFNELINAKQLMMSMLYKDSLKVERKKLEQCQ